MFHADQRRRVAAARGGGARQWLLPSSGRPIREKKEGWAGRATKERRRGLCLRERKERRLLSERKREGDKRFRVDFKSL